jgi:hypothetical protein
VGATLLEGQKRKGKIPKPKLCRTLPKRSWKWSLLFMRIARVMVIVIGF